MDILVIIIGLIVIFDGVISYILQPKEHILWQIGRFLRVFLGILLSIYTLFYPTLFLNQVLNIDPFLIIIGIIIIIDGVISIIKQIDNLLYRIGRGFRIVIGLVLVVYALYFAGAFII